MNRIFLILFLGLLSATSVFARETVKGIVVDSKGDPMPGVKVDIPGTNESVYTDLDGVFQIILREPAKQLQFFYPGYGTSTHKVEPEMKVVLGKGWEGQTECYRGMVDLEGGIGLGGNFTIKRDYNEFRDIHTLLLAGATTTHGAQITRNFFLGFGTGAYLDFTQFEEIGVNSNTSYSSYNYFFFSGVHIPLFMSTRWDFGLTKKTAPYIGLRLGYSMYIPTNNYHEWHRRYLDVSRNCIGSYFFQPMVGYRTTIYRKFSINLGLSYLSGRLAKYTAESYESNYHNHLKSKYIKRDDGTILFNIGFDF
ncbi:MAG: carboxypeptidase-like regulatory domain-containing protein [Muribaculaceae bacterium]|nr:carboxypeptidase-like regulatory domain-containing protein [Muribaculaceae bacterium]